MVCNGAVILTEDRIIMFGSNVAASASASDYISGTTLCTSICCCCPCCYGKRIFGFPHGPSPYPLHPPPSQTADTPALLQGFVGALGRAGSLAFTISSSRTVKMRSL